jgi:lysozyme family protein
MTATNYANCLAVTLEYEGGYSNDPSDPGGPTKYGITIHDVRQYLKQNATAADVKNLTVDQAKTIYRAHYWTPMCGDQWPDGLDLTVWDAGVNSGTGRSKTWAQQTLKASAASDFLELATIAKTIKDYTPQIKDFNGRRLSFLHALRTWAVFGKGWGRRVAGIEAKSVAMALAFMGLTPAQQKERLSREATDAAKKGWQNAGGAGGAGATGGGGFTLDWSDKYLIAAGCVVLLIVFGWWAWAHYQRSAAYREAAQSV